MMFIMNFFSTLKITLIYYKIKNKFDKICIFFDENLWKFTYKNLFSQYKKMIFFCDHNKLKSIFYKEIMKQFLWLSWFFSDRRKKLHQISSKIIISIIFHKK